MHEELKLDNQLCFRLYTASRLMTQAYYPLFKALGISYPQYLVLMILWEKDRQPVNDIAKRLLLETNTVTPLLQRMEKEGLVSRQKDPVDSRKVIVSLTDKGREMEAEAAEVPHCITGRLNCSESLMEQLPSIATSLDELIGILR